MLFLIKLLRKPQVWLLIMVLSFSACSNNTDSVVVDTPTQEVIIFTPTPEPPTPTPLPAAAVVNGERIPLAWFRNEVDRYLSAQEAMGQPLPDEATARQIVMDDVIDQVLLAQGARETGATLGVADVQARIDKLAEDVDLATWMVDWGYREEDLLISLTFQMLAAYQRDQIMNSVPAIQEQVELRQILTYTETGANTALISLNSGTPFEEVAFNYRPDRPYVGGYLGWVPRGYLLIPVVEEVAFDLPVGAYSDIIESDIGYHIIQVMDREERSLTTDARLFLQRQALYSWLAERRENGTIEVLED
jgi:peptidyl-prolyl cis-trans isomerase C